ncbi:MAG: tetratricopeptide repeat protein [Spirochaetes bacterium]|nr:tetratricopeptide repeat protein [Spirochaetota bacterium]
MKKKHIKPNDLFKYFFETLPEKKAKKIKEHLDVCETCRGEFKKLDTVFQPALKPEEKEIPQHRIDAMYKSFLERLEEKERSDEKVPFRGLVLKPALVFSLAAFVIMIGLWIITAPLRRPILITQYTQEKILIDGKEYDLAKVKHLPLDRVIKTRGQMDLTIRRSARLVVSPDTEFKVIKKDKYICSLKQGQMKLKTLERKNLYVQVNHYMIKPVGTIYQINFRENILKVFLLKGKLELENLKNKDRSYMTPLKDVFIFDFTRNKPVKDLPTLSAGQIDALDQAKRYEKNKDWKNALEMYDHFLNSKPSDPEMESEALYHSGIIFYEHFQNSEKAQEYFDRLLKLKVYEDFSDRIPREFLHDKK